MFYDTTKVPITMETFCEKVPLLFGLRHMPPDEQGILRISVGGGEDLPVQLDYCVFRGNRGHCIDLLRRDLKAMESR